MVTFLIIVVAIMAFMFVKDSYNENDKLVKEGGMMVKYKTLISHFVEPESGMKIIKKTNNYVCVGMSNRSGSVVFHFQHTFDKINVTMEVKNVFIGNHKLEWDFPETMSQEKMIDQIQTRSRQYMENVSANFN